jgi:hypothetical protein
MGDGRLEGECMEENWSLVGQRSGRGVGHEDYDVNVETRTVIPRIVRNGSNVS